MRFLATVIAAACIISFPAMGQDSTVPKRQGYRNGKPITKDTPPPNKKPPNVHEVREAAGYAYQKPKAAAADPELGIGLGFCCTFLVFGGLVAVGAVFYVLAKSGDDSKEDGMGEHFSNLSEYYICVGKNDTGQLDYGRCHSLCCRCGKDHMEMGKRRDNVFLSPVDAHIMKNILTKALEWGEGYEIGEEEHVEEQYLKHFADCLYCGKLLPKVLEDFRTYKNLGEQKWTEEIVANTYIGSLNLRIASLEEKARKGDLIAFEEWKKLKETSP